MQKYRAIILLIVSLQVFTSFRTDTGFRAGQLENDRVKKVFDEREDEVKTMIRLSKLNADGFELYIRAFKTEGILEAWGRNRNEKAYKLIATYPFCSNVGVCGPKRQEGDMQIPEGFYKLSKFNPKSNYHLSLKVSYPNKSDSLLSPHEKLGGQIFIHGGCLTVGCIPITDWSIEELYVMSVLARDQGQTSIPIHIFPARMNYSNYKLLLEKHEDNELHVFWTNLKPVYQHFEQTGELLGITINHQGRYLFSK